MYQQSLLAGKPLLLIINTVELSGSNIDGSFTTGCFEHVLESLGKSSGCRFNIIKGDFLVFFFN